MEAKVGISCSCCLKGNLAKMGMIPLLTWLDSFCFWDEHIFNVKLKLYFYPHRDPYVIALRSVTVATVPPEESSIRSEAICAGFLVHELGYSTCKVPTTVWHLKLKNNKTLSCWIWTFLAALLGVLLQPGDLWSAALCGGKLSGLVQIYGRDGNVLHFFSGERCAYHSVLMRNIVVLGFILFSFKAMITTATIKGLVHPKIQVF